VPAPDDDLLRRLPFFRRLTPALRARVSAVARLKTYDSQELIFAEGDPSDAFMVIVDGRVKVFKSTPAGKEIILEIFGAGDPLGAVAVYESVPFMASAQTLEPARILRIEQPAFFQLLEQDPQFVRGLLSGLTLRLAELKLCDQIGRQERGGTFVPMPLSRQELADLTGTTIETAIRIMSRWQKDDVVHTEKDGFVVIDRDGLEAASAG
jgi:CRP/FNR family transcriptional regulator